jgi:hypothetical protein
MMMYVKRRILLNGRTLNNHIPTDGGSLRSGESQPFFMETDIYHYENFVN